MQNLLEPPENIHYRSDDTPGYKRLISRSNHVYVSASNKPVTDQSDLERIEALVIPPNWKEVWISADPNGHLQTTGYDERDRKQYIYHAAWVAHRQKSKFARLPVFGKALNQIRTRVERDIKQKGWPKSRVLALIVTLMDSHYLRIGNAYYKNHNQTYGLTTLRRKHLEKKDDQLKLSYKAKSGKYRNITLKNRSLIKLILATSDLPGYGIFRYLDESGKSAKVDSQDVNDYLRHICSENITAKDFRTWGGTVLAIASYDPAKQDLLENPRSKLEAAIVRRVAKKLGNTIATCREYYIHPKVLQVLTDQKLSEYSVSETEVETYKHLSNNEKLAIKIINA